MKRSPRMSEAELADFMAKRALTGPKPAPAPIVRPSPKSPAQPPVGLGGRVIRLVCHGIPQPAGSKQAFVPLHPTRMCNCGDTPGKLPYRRPGGGIVVSVVDANKHSKRWQSVIAKEAREVYGGKPVEVALMVHFTFYVDRPKSHYGTGRNLNILKASAPEFPTGPADCLKLARGVEDAMQEIVYRNDSQIVSETIQKFYGSPARVEIEIQEMPSKRAAEPTLPLGEPPPWGSTL